MASLSESIGDNARRQFYMRYGNTFSRVRPAGNERWAIDMPDGAILAAYAAPHFVRKWPIEPIRACPLTVRC